MLDRWWSPALICRQLKEAFPGRTDRAHSPRNVLPSPLHQWPRRAVQGARQMPSHWPGPAETQRINCQKILQARQRRVDDQRPSGGSGRLFRSRSVGRRPDYQHPEPFRHRHVDREERPLPAPGALPGINRAEDLRDELIKAFNPLPACVANIADLRPGERDGHARRIQPPASRSNSVIPTRPGNAARTRTGMGCCASTFPGTLTCPFTLPALGRCRHGPQQPTAENPQRGHSLRALC